MPAPCVTSRRAIVRDLAGECSRGRNPAEFAVLLVRAHTGAGEYSAARDPAPCSVDARSAATVAARGSGGAGRPRIVNSRTQLYARRSLILFSGAPHRAMMDQTSSQTLTAGPGAGWLDYAPAPAIPDE